LRYLSPFSGDLPSHGPYAPPKRAPEILDRPATVSIAQLNGWLAAGANLNVELNNAVLAGDKVRIGYLLDRKHARSTPRNLQGETALQTAIARNRHSWSATCLRAVQAWRYPTATAGRR